MKFKNLTLLLLLTSTFSLLTSCDTTDPPSNKKITLEFEDASCTEAWLNLKTENISLPTEIEVIQNDSTFLTANLNCNDTTLFIDNLIPNQTYTFNTAIKQLNNETIKSSSLSITTMDTTSHNFTWETFEFGEQSNSHFKDVAIINENNIWAIGEIHTNETDKFDSNGVWVKPYNAVHWDGVNWELKRILVDYRGEKNFAPLTGVFALPDGQIIFSSGLPYLPKGNSWQLYHLWDMGVFDENDGSVNYIWGTSIDNLYFVGTKGTIAHYNGKSWTKIESGTELPLNDITHSDNGLYVSGYSSFTGESILLKINGNTASIVWQDDSEEAIEKFGEGIYTVKGFNKIMFVGSNIGISECFVEQNLMSKHIYITRNHISKIFGKSSNNVFTAGYQSNINHFNGKTTQNVYSNYQSSNTFYSGDATDNIVAGVGTKVVTVIFHKAIITIGKRI